MIWLSIFLLNACPFINWLLASVPVEIPCTPIPCDPLTYPKAPVPVVPLAENTPPSPSSPLAFP